MCICEETAAAHTAVQQSTLGLWDLHCLYSHVLACAEGTELCSMFCSFTLFAINSSNPQEYSLTCRLRWVT